MLCAFVGAVDVCLVWVSFFLLSFQGVCFVYDIIVVCKIDIIRIVTSRNYFAGSQVSNC